MSARPADDAWRLLEAVPDPELPVLSVVDLGVVRAVEVVGGAVRVDLTPTYTGCSATDAIRQAVASALAERFDRVEIRTVLSPAWSTDDLSPGARAKLRRYGIAPPGRERDAAPACPRCGAADTELLSPFGSTPCKALHRCRACREPFDAFKCL